MKIIYFLLFIASFTNGFSQGYWKRVHGDGISLTPVTIGTYDPGNSPIARYAAACMKDSSGTFWLYGGNGGNDLWRFDPELNQWLIANGTFEAVGVTANYGIMGVPAPSNQPGPAGFGHPSWGDHLGNLWLYGIGGLNDLWKFDISTGMWTWVKGTASPGPAIYGTKGVPAATNNPGMCNETDCHWTDTDGLLWLYTEFDGNLWNFNPITEMWTWITGQADAGILPTFGTIDEYAIDNTPGGFSACPAVGVLYSMWITSDDHLWMLVNRFEAVLQTEIWEFNPTLEQWRCRRIDISEFGEPQVFPEACLDGNPDIFPISRTEMRVEWVDNCDHLYFFGGANFCIMSPAYNDIWRYDPVTNTYTYIKGGTSPITPGTQDVFDVDNFPTMSAGGQAWQNEKGFYTMGGMNPSGEMTNDVWLYSPDTVVANFSFTTDCYEVSFTNETTTGCNYLKNSFWKFDDGSTSLEENPIHSYPSNGTYEVQLIVENCSWHTDSVTYSIIIDCGFTIDLEDDTICIGDCIELIATSFEDTDFIDFEWDNGITENNDSVLVCPITTTIYRIIGTNITGDIDTAYATIVVLMPPLVDLGNDTTLCEGSLLLDAENMGSSYLWQDGSTAQTFTVTETGIYHVEVNNGGCSIIDSVFVTINGPNIHLGNDTLTCNPTWVLDAGNPGATYLWQDGSTEQTYPISDVGLYYVDVTDADGCWSTDTINISLDTIDVNLGNDTLLCVGTSLIIGTNIAGATYFWQDSSTDSLFTVTEAGVYSVEVNHFLCTKSDTIVVSYGGITAAFAATDTIGCVSTEVNFTDYSFGGTITSWLWDFGDGTSSTLQHPTYSYETSGLYNINLTVSNAAGCVSDTLKSITILIYPQPIAAFTFEPDNPIVGEEMLFIDLSINALTWNWDFNDGYTSVEQNPSHIYTSYDNYNIQLIVTNNSCSDSAIITFFVEEELIFFVPNTFTPDGDTFNDVFLPIFTSGFNPFDYHLTIFNRWGEIVFESYNAAIGWDGTYPNCGIVQDGTYIWQIEFGDVNSDKKYIKRGHVNLLK